MAKVKPINVILICAASSVTIAVLCDLAHIWISSRRLEIAGFIFTGISAAIASIPLLGGLLYSATSVVKDKWRRGHPGRKTPPEI